MPDSIFPGTSAAAPNGAGRAVAPVGRTWTLRRVALGVSLALWFGVLLLRTGSGSLHAAWNVSLFLLELLAVTVLTRTVAVGRILVCVMAGSAVFGLAWLGGAGLALLEGGHATAAHYLVIPVFEEACKVGVIAVILWNWRRLVTWTLGAGDVMLMSAAVGAGFQFMEDAYILHHGSAAIGLNLAGGSAIRWFPSLAIEGGRHVRYIAGHGMWAALAGALLGLALLLRHRRGLALSLGASGFLWAVLDHIRVNYTNHFSGVVAKALQWVTAEGRVTLALFVAAVAAVVIADMYVSSTALPKWPELAPRLGGGATLILRWRRERNRRALAYLVFRATRTTARLRPACVQMIARVGFGFLAERFRNLAPQPPGK
jgi:hypothetical protein